MRKKLFISLLLLFTLITSCGFGDGSFELNPGENTGGGDNYHSGIYFMIEVTGDFQVMVTPPERFSPLVNYPGIDAVRVSDQIQFQSWFSGDKHNKLVIEIINMGQDTINRVWLVGVAQRNVKVLNPDARNKNNQPVFVLGPIPAGGAYSRKITVEFNGFPAILKWDTIQVNNRVAYASDFGQSTSTRLWSSDLSGQLQFKITDFKDSFIKNGRSGWSPGMEWIAFDYFGTSKEGIAVVHPDGSHFKFLFLNSNQPSFFPDGKHIFYSCHDRIPTSAYDICVNDLSGLNEQVLIRGDGYYWDGSAFQTYTPLQGDSAWLYKVLYNPRLSPDGKRIVFMAQEPEQALGPGGGMINRWRLLDAEFDPGKMTLESKPRLTGKLFDGDTLSNSNYYIGLYEFIPSFSPDGTNLVGFLKIQKRNPSTKKWSLDFYGLARLKIAELQSQPSSVYLGNYLTRIYDIRNFSSQIDALYINFQDYSPEVGGIIFSVKFDAFYGSLYLLRVDDNFQPLGAPEVFIRNAFFNAYPDISTPMVPGYYR